MENGSSREPRSDARSNRLQILAVARAAFAGEGLDVTMREVARRADLGVATVYRHFPAREDLVSAVFAEQVRECVATVAAAAADPDVWQGMTTIVDEACRRQAFDRGLNEALLGSATSQEVFRTERAANMRALRRLLSRAHREGLVRTDFTADDFGLVLSALASPRINRSNPRRTYAELRRLAAVLLRGMRADDQVPVGASASSTKA